jgi:hypothetical protein
MSLLQELVLRLCAETLDRLTSPPILAQAVFHGQAAFHNRKFPTTVPRVKDSHKSTYKKVVVRRLDHGLIKGFVDSTSYLRSNGIEMLDREGRTVLIPLHEIKGVFFVRDFDGNPQRAERKLFQSRPRLAGLWVQMTFKDKEVLEGLLPSNLMELSPEGFLVTPADLYSNNLKIFVPRTALSEINVLGVISNGRLRRPSQKRGGQPSEAATAQRQIDLFPASERQEKKQS